MVWLHRQHYFSIKSLFRIPDRYLSSQSIILDGSTAHILMRRTRVPDWQRKCRHCQISNLWSSLRSTISLSSAFVWLLLPSCRNDSMRLRPLKCLWRWYAHRLLLSRVSSRMTLYTVKIIRCQIGFPGLNFVCSSWSSDRSYGTLSVFLYFYHFNSLCLTLFRNQNERWDFCLKVVFRTHRHSSNLTIGYYIIMFRLISVHVWVCCAPSHLDYYHWIAEWRCGPPPPV